MPIVWALFLACAARWGHDRLTRLLQWLKHALLGVVSLVGNHRARRGCAQQCVCALQIMSLSRRQKKPRGIAQRIDCCVYLGAQSTPATPDGLLFWIPPSAPELCWWARTIVELIIAYSLSASCANALKMRSPTRRSCSSANGADAPPGSLRIAREDRATGCRTGGWCSSSRGK